MKAVKNDSLNNLLQRIIQPHFFPFVSAEPSHFHRIGNDVRDTVVVKSRVTQPQHLLLLRVSVVGFYENLRTLNWPKHSSSEEKKRIKHVQKFCCLR